MSSVTIPVTPDVPHFDFQVLLERATYTFELRWNERSSTWSLSLYDVGGTLLTAGRSVVLGAELLGRSGDARLPPGQLFAIDTSGKDQEAGRYDLGGRVQLIYVESSGG